MGVAGDGGALCWAVSGCEGGYQPSRICPILSPHRKQALWTLWVDSRLCWLEGLSAWFSSLFLI